MKTDVRKHSYRKAIKENRAYLVLPKLSTIQDSYPNFYSNIHKDSTRDGEEEKSSQSSSYIQ